MDTPLAGGGGAPKEPAQPRVLSATCLDEACCARLFFPSYDQSVECPQCGQRHDRTALRDVQEVSNPGIAFHSLIRNILISNLVPKHGEDTIKVRGLSNYHCKLVSPLLTTYGMDKQSGKARLLSEMGAGTYFDCSVLGVRAFRIDPELVDVAGYGKDVSGSLSYLRGTLALVRAHNDGEDRLLPVHVDGDGHCLVHAVSRALVGRELFWHPLRCHLKRHLEEHLSKYKELLKDFVDEKEWPAIIAECDPDFLPPEGELLGLRNIHVFSLANVLRRPIILLDSLAGMQSPGDYAALFLPSLVAPEQCRGGPCNRRNPPLCLSWSSSGRNHYIPLVGVRMGDKLPQIPRSLLPKAWGVPHCLVDSYIDFDAKGCCVVGGDHQLSEGYLMRLTAAMDEVFQQKYGVHPTLVADVHHYVYKRTGVVGVHSSLVVRATQKALAERRLYRCLTCNAVCEHHVSPEWFRPGGLLYTTLQESVMNPMPEKLYTFEQYGVTCWYNREKDELVPVIAKNTLEHCTWCKSTQVRHLRGDGTLELRNGDRTRTPSNSKYCSCGFKHFWDGKEYDTMPLQITVSLEWNDKVVKDTVFWFQHESDASLNSNVYTVASEVVNKHFPGVFGSERLLQQVVDQILEQTRLPEDSMEEDRAEGSDLEAGGVGRCRSPHRPLTTPSSSSAAASKFIIKGYKTLHKEELGVSETERRLLERIQGHATTSRRKHGSPERDRQSAVSAASATSPISVVSNTSLSMAQPTVVERPNFVRVVTSDGRQGQLRPSALGITLAELQAWVSAEFGIPAERQLLKSGIPPRVLAEPSDGGALSLSHGDRVIVEVIGTDPSVSGVAQGGPLNAASTSVATLEGDLVKHLQEAQKILSLESGLRAMLGHLKGTGATVWSYAQENEWLFCRGGLFYAQMQRDVGLVDGKHCHLPLIPDKVFTYNAKHDRLELCFEPYGHFAIGPDVEAKIASGQVGSTGQHHQSPTTSPTLAVAASVSSTAAAEGASTPAESSNTAGSSTDEKSAGVVSKPSRTVVRKGPGFTVLAPASPEKPRKTAEYEHSEQERALEQLQTVVSMLQDQESRAVIEADPEPSCRRRGDNEDPDRMDTD